MIRCRISESIAVGDDCPLALIAGPCVLESEDFNLKMAELIASICEQVGVSFIFKSSFDKANRSSIEAYRGFPMDEGLEILSRIRTRVGVPVLTDVHESHQAEPAAEVADVLQIPAFLSRQTDLLVAAARTGKPVNVKKGPFLAPWDMRNVVGKLRSGGADEILLTERGTSFGYNALVVDFRSLQQMRDLGHPVVFDATHSVQQPGALGDRSGGEREFVAALARAAVAVGVDALYMEVHEDPERALSDAATSLGIETLEATLKQAIDIRDALTGP